MKAAPNSSQVSKKPGKENGFSGWQEGKEKRRIEEADETMVEGLHYAVVFLHNASPLDDEPPGHRRV